MSLIVEDGTGKSTSESYISVADASTYHAARGNTLWADVVELLTLDVAPATAWAVGNTIHGNTSGADCVIVQVLTNKTFYVKNRTGAFTLGEIMTNGTYTADQGAANPTFAATDELREQWLRKATEYMTAMYRDKWRGQRTTATVQALCWPRVGVTIEGVYVDSATIPETIKRVCAELALKVSSADLLSDLTQGVLSEQIGSIAITYDKSSPRQIRYTAIDAMLAPYLKAGSNSISMGLVRT